MSFDKVSRQKSVTSEVGVFLKSKFTSFFDRVRIPSSTASSADEAAGNILREKETILRGKFAHDIASTTIDERLSRDFFEAVSALCHAYLCSEFDRDEKVIDFRHPSSLRHEIDGVLDMKKLDAVDTAQLLRDCDFVLRHCVRTGHPRFFNQISNGIDFVSVAGEWITATVNTNMSVYL